MEPLLPCNGRPGGQWADHWKSVNGVLFRARTGVPWPDPLIQYDNLRGILRRTVQARRKVLILDCCYAARAFDGRMAAASLPQLSGPVNVAGTVMLSAASETRQAVAPEKARFTAYTGALVSVLEQGVPGTDEWLTVELVHDRVAEVLAAEGHPSPQISSRNLARSIVLARNPARRPGAAAADPHTQQDALLRFQQLGPESMVETLTSRLQALRAAAGQPSLRRLARDTGLPQGALADALSGSCLPDLLVVTKLVGALDPGADQEAWDSWWSASARQVRKAKAQGECAHITLQPQPASVSPDEGMHRVNVLTRDAEREVGTRDPPSSVEQALRTLAGRLPRHEGKRSAPTWKALRDYLMLVIQLFDPEPFPVHPASGGSPAEVALVESVLPRLAALADPDITGVPEWKDLAEDIYREAADEQMSSRKCDALLQTSVGPYMSTGLAIYYQDIEKYALYRAHAASMALRLARLSAPVLSAGARVPDRPSLIEDPSPLPKLPEFLGNEREVTLRQLVPTVAMASALGVSWLTDLADPSPAVDLGVFFTVFVVVLLSGWRWLKQRVNAYEKARRDHYRRRRPW
ncbi:hypothetical protein ACFXDH_47980 [Streptomyces sp. NPDC059467]|uniref:hypothetical protein n=1 Tax=Streptomyces sp. NPDC059467 TaxID=3346844 RepID=UPI0036B612A8